MAQSQALERESHFRLTPTGIEVVGEPTFDDWLADTEYLLEIMMSLPIAVGDMLRYGEQRWPDQYAQAIDIFKVRYKDRTLINYMSVASRVPRAVRQEVSYGHLEAVAKLPMPAQAKLLKAAVDTGMTRDELRDEVKRLCGETPPRRLRFRCRSVRRVEDAYILEYPSFEEGEFYEDSEADATVRSWPTRG